LDIQRVMDQKASIGINKTNAIAIIITGFTNYLSYSIILVNNVNETKTILGKNHVVLVMMKIAVTRRDKT